VRTTGGVRTDPPARILFDRRDFDAAEAFWSENYIRHSALIPPGREALFNRVRSLYVACA